MWMWQKQFTVARRRWNTDSADGCESKDLTGSDRARATTQKQDQRILSLAEKQPFATVQHIKKQLHWQWVVVCERTVYRRFNEPGCKIQSANVKAIAHGTSFKMDTTA